VLWKQWLEHAFFFRDNLEISSATDGKRRRDFQSKQASVGSNPLLLS
jgi:hypothetical protein